MIESIDLNGYSIPELRSLSERIEKEIAAKRQNEVQKLRDQIQQLASSAGLSVEEIFAAKKEAAPKAKEEVKVKAVVLPKYRNPANAEETWSGRGKAPAWMRDLLLAGRDKEDFKIVD